MQFGLFEVKSHAKGGLTEPPLDCLQTSPTQMFLSKAAELYYDEIFHSIV